MKRLSELQSDDPALQTAQQLLSSVEPLATSQERMWRVRRAMEEKRAARGAGWRRLGFGPRALGLAALLLLVGGGSTLAAAQSGALSAMIARVVQVIQLAPAAPPTAKRPQAKRALTAPVPARDAVTTPAAVTVATTSEPEVVLPGPETVPTARAVPQPKHHARARAAQAAAADNEIVRRAVKALRRDGNPALAARLLDEAHRKSPDGALAEEVMSLRVEAALARGDAKAGSYAREYLARYPQGRYRQQVEQALR